MSAVWLAAARQGTPATSAAPLAATAREAIR
jgi:hypothetical protein